MFSQPLEKQQQLYQNLEKVRILLLYSFLSVFFGVFYIYILFQLNLKNMQKLRN